MGYLAAVRMDIRVAMVEDAGATGFAKALGDLTECKVLNVQMKEAEGIIL